MGRPRSTIQNFIQRYIERGTHENKPLPGQQKKITKSTEDAVLALIEGNASISKLKLIQNIPELQDVHPRTVDRMLRGKGIQKWIARKRPKLLPRHASARLAWALERKDWTVEQWKKYIWSDECSVERSKGGGAKWVWRKKGEDRYEAEAVDPCRYMTSFPNLTIISNIYIGQLEIYLSWYGGVSMDRQRDIYGHCWKGTTMLSDMLRFWNIVLVMFVWT